MKLDARGLTCLPLSQDLLPARLMRAMAWFVETNQRDQSSLGIKLLMLGRELPCGAKMSIKCITFLGVYAKRTDANNGKSKMVGWVESPSVKPSLTSLAGSDPFLLVSVSRTVFMAFGGHFC